MKSKSDLRNEIVRLQETLSQHEATVAALKADIDGIYHSASWRLTKPYRCIGRLAKPVLRKVLPGRMLSALRILRREGRTGIKRGLQRRKQIRVRRKAWGRRRGFTLYPQAFGCPQDVFRRQQAADFSKKVKFSILVPLYNTPKDFLQEMIASVLIQSYGNWELCLADGSDAQHGYVERLCRKIAEKDSRIRYQKLGRNGGISENTNVCLGMATGDYISLLDHDDLLHPSALYETAKAVCEKEAEFIYTDELWFESPDLHHVLGTNFKPDFAPDYFHGNNYICHFTSFKKSLLEKAGRFEGAYDGAQDYDLFLRLTEITDNIVHIPKCLYYWRACPTSVASGADKKTYTTDAGKRALEAHFKRLGIQASVNTGNVPNIYRVAYPIKENPLVSIIIPNNDHRDLLQKCLESIRSLSTYGNYEVIIVENNSTDRELFSYYDDLKSSGNIKVVTYEGTFNYPAINNYGAGYARGEYLLLLNNDVEVISPGWMEEMLMFAQRPDVGAVGAKLYYPSDLVQHAGVVLGINGVAGHSHKGYPRDSYGYVSRLAIVQDYTAVTGACMMMRRSLYMQLGGLDESYAVAFNDVDLCMRIRDAGYLVVWTPFAELYHYESASRGYEDNPEKWLRFDREVAAFKARWRKELEAGDPYYNPNLTLAREDFSPEGDVFNMQCL